MLILINWKPKNILEEEFITDLVFERDYVLENGKTISRIWVEKLGVSVSNRQYGMKSLLL
jgi:hypothetical protein